MRFLLILPLLCLVTGCERQDVIIQAKTDFHARNPGWEIVKAYSREDKGGDVTVHVRYIHTPAAVIPSNPSILEMQLRYRKTGGGWALISEVGSRYIGPAH